MNVAPVEEIVNTIFNGDCILIDTRSIEEHNSMRVLGSISCPPPLSMSNFAKVPSLNWVGLYCISTEQQQLFSTASSYSQRYNVLIGVGSLHGDISWAERLYDLFEEANTELGKIGNKIRILNLTAFYRDCPIMFSPSTVTIWDRCKPPTVIISNFLFISSLQEAMNPKICGPHGYIKPTHIVNASNKHNTNIFEGLGIKYLVVDVEDNENSKISQHFEAIYQFVEECRRAKGSVVLHCQMGISRSATFCIYYLMRSQGMSLLDAYNHVKSRRIEIFPNRSFMTQLIAAEKDLHHRREALVKIRVEDQGIPCNSRGSLVNCGDSLSVEESKGEDDDDDDTAEQDISLNMHDIDLSSPNKFQTVLTGSNSQLACDDDTLDQAGSGSGESLDYAHMHTCTAVRYVSNWQPSVTLDDLGTIGGLKTEYGAKTPRSEVKEGQGMVRMCTIGGELGAMSFVKQCSVM